MKSKILLVFFLLSYLKSVSQNLQLKITGESTTETKIIDSIGYSSKHQNAKQITEEINIISDKLAKIGFINNQIQQNKKENDSTYKAIISLNKKIKNIHIYIGIKNKIYLDNILEKNQDSVLLSYYQTESFLKQILQNLEKNGYSFAKVKLTNIIQKNNNLHANLSISSGNKRILNAIEIKYTDTQQKKLFPKGAKKQISKKYKKAILNKETITQINHDFEEFGFVNQIKFPEILFTKDTTKVFVYLEKRKANNFDGYLGFNTTENKKIQLNGYLDLTLVNALRNGEELSVYWKNDGNNQKIFNANLNIPYLFNTPMALKAQINIFKQDSIFQNTKTALQLGYFLNYNKRIYIGYETTESSDIQNLNNQTFTDYQNTFYITSIEFKISNTRNKLFSTKSYLNATLGTGHRTTYSHPSLQQSFVNFNIMNDFYINEKNIINVKNQNYYLKSENYIVNELFRFGGINSIRGFLENSLQANLMLGVMTEYRYLLSSNLYINSIIDYCYYEDYTTVINNKYNQKLLGIGLGLGAQTSNGLLKFAITNGKAENQEIKFYNTNITISYNVKF